jgi:hypothetical protein
VSDTRRAGLKLFFSGCTFFSSVFLRQNTTEPRETLLLEQNKMAAPTAKRFFGGPGIKSCIKRGAYWHPVAGLPAFKIVLAALKMRLAL